jgi:hypothetical protein
MNPDQNGVTARAVLAGAALLGFAVAANGAPCTATSPESRVALLELYTSEGCSSCPPTDRWVSQLPRRGLTSERVVVLGFHVDYWDYIGWPDPYAQRRFSERQRHANTRNGARFVYTPQLMLEGKDYRRGLWRDDFVATLAAINSERPGAHLSLILTPGDGTIDAQAGVTVDDAQSRESADVYLALLENRLGNDVTAGENRGRSLTHDFVVRELAGPYSAQHTPGPEHRFVLGSGWKTADLTVAAFAKRRDSGAVLQALALPYCSVNRSTK